MNERQLKRAYCKGIVNTLQFLTISGFFTFILCDAIARLF